MFDSGKTAQKLIQELKTEADIAVEIPDSYYIDWLNAVEQTLYDNVIREEDYESQEVGAVSGSGFRTVPVELGDYWLTTDYGEVRFEDVKNVYFGTSLDDSVGRKLTRVSASVGLTQLFPYCYFAFARDDTKLNAYIPKTAGNITVVITVRPILKTTSNVGAQNVAVPAEYLDMVKAKLRGEAYKFANEDALAAKWLADYNSQLEYFRAWIASKNSTIGV